MSSRFSVGGGVSRRVEDPSCSGSLTRTLDRAGGEAGKPSQMDGRDPDLVVVEGYSIRPR